MEKSKDVKREYQPHRRGGGKFHIPTHDFVFSSEMKPLSEFEMDYIVEVLKYYDGNKSRTAKFLDISVRTLYAKLIEHGLHERAEKIESGLLNYDKR